MNFLSKIIFKKLNKDNPSNNNYTNINTHDLINIISDDIDNKSSVENNTLNNNTYSDIIEESRESELSKSLCNSSRLSSLKNTGVNLLKKSIFITDNYTCDLKIKTVQIRKKSMLLKYNYSLINNAKILEKGTQSLKISKRKLFLLKKSVDLNTKSLGLESKNKKYNVRFNLNTLGEKKESAFNIDKEEDKVLIDSNKSTSNTGQISKRKRIAKNKNIIFTMNKNKSSSVILKKMMFKTLSIFQTNQIKSSSSSVIEQLIQELEIGEKEFKCKTKRKQVPNTISDNLACLNNSIDNINNNKFGDLFNDIKFESLLKKKKLKVNKKLFANQNKECLFNKNSFVNLNNMRNSKSNLNNINSDENINKKRDGLKVLNLLKMIPDFKKFIEFNYISEECIIKSVDYFKFVEFEPGMYIFNQGDESDGFYCVLTGIVDITRKKRNFSDIFNKLSKEEAENNKLNQDYYYEGVNNNNVSISKSKKEKYSNIKKINLLINNLSIKKFLSLEEKINSYNSGNIFGEWSLVDNTKRKANAITKTKCSLLKITKEVYNAFYKKYLIKAENRRKEFLKKSIPSFSAIHKYSFDIIYRKISIVNYPKGSVILSSSTQPIYFYVILTGECLSIYKKGCNDEEKFILSKGSIFGLEALNDINNNLDIKYKNKSSKELSKLTLFSNILNSNNNSEDLYKNNSYKFLIEAKTDISLFRIPFEMLKQDRLKETLECLIKWRSKACSIRDSFTQNKFKVNNSKAKLNYSSNNLKLNNYREYKHQFTDKVIFKEIEKINLSKSINPEVNYSINKGESMNYKTKLNKEFINFDKSRIRNLFNSDNNSYALKINNRYSFTSFYDKNVKLIRSKKSLLNNTVVSSSNLIKNFSSALITKESCRIKSSDNKNYLCEKNNSKLKDISNRNQFKVNEPLSKIMTNYFIDKDNSLNIKNKEGNGLKSLKSLNIDKIKKQKNYTANNCCNILQNKINNYVYKISKNEKAFNCSNKFMSIDNNQLNQNDKTNNTTECNNKSASKNKFKRKYNKFFTCKNIKLNTIDRLKNNVELLNIKGNKINDYNFENINKLPSNDNNIENANNKSLFKTNIDKKLSNANIKNISQLNILKNFKSKDSLNKDFNRQNNIKHSLKVHNNYFNIKSFSQLDFSSLKVSSHNMDKNKYSELYKLTDSQNNINSSTSYNDKYSKTIQSFSKNNRKHLNENIKIKQNQHQSNEKSLIKKNIDFNEDNFKYNLHNNNYFNSSIKYIRNNSNNKLNVRPENKRIFDVCNINKNKYLSSKEIKHITVNTDTIGNSNNIKEDYRLKQQLVNLNKNTKKNNNKSLNYKVFYNSGDFNLPLLSLNN